MPSALLVVLDVAVGLVLAVSVVRMAARSRPITVRLDACREAAMAVAMAYMLLLTA